jgi:hypothetical protein
MRKVFIKKHKNMMSSINIFLRELASLIALKELEQVSTDIVWELLGHFIKNINLLV